MRRVLIALCVAIVACGGETGGQTTTTVVDTITTITTTTSTTTTTTIPPTTTTTLSEEQLAEIQLEEDIAEIKRLFRGYSDSWFTNEDAGFAYLEAHNYPAEGCTAADYRDLWQVADGFTEEIVVDQSTIEPDVGWAIPGGQVAGTVPDGRIYIFSATITSRADGFEPSSLSAEIHATVTDTGTYFFIDCRG